MIALGSIFLAVMLIAFFSILGYIYAYILDKRKAKNGKRDKRS